LGLRDTYDFYLLGCAWCAEMLLMLTIEQLPGYETDFIWWKQAFRKSFRPVYAKYEVVNIVYA
jgi:hypothetical protein